MVEAVLNRRVPRSTRHILRLREAWTQILPEFLQRGLWPASIRGERLIVHARDNQWLHELTYLRQELLEKLAQQAPEFGIRAIEARLAPIPEPAPPPDPIPPPPRRPPALSANEDEETRARLEQIEDPELKATLERTERALRRQT